MQYRCQACHRRLLTPAYTAPSGYVLGPKCAIVAGKLKPARRKGGACRGAAVVLAHPGQLDMFVILECAGQICELRRQVPFELVPGVKFAGAARARPALRYFADFVYTEHDKQVIEDVKGVETPEFKIKRHLMLALLGLEVRVTA